MKILHPELLKDLGLLSSFKEEASNLARLKHPNIVQIYDASITQQFPYLVMEYIQGRACANSSRNSRKIRPAYQITTSLRIVYSVGLALAFAHKNNVIHRDIKPSNILLEDTGRVVLSDFGLARLLVSQNQA